MSTRQLPDPHKDGYVWYVWNGDLYLQCGVFIPQQVWKMEWPVPPTWEFHETPERMVLWIDLFLNPTEP